MPRLRICGEPTVRDAIARPGQPVAELVDHPGVRHAGAQPEAAVVGRPLGQLGDPVRSSSAAGPLPVEVDLDHHVGAARDRQRAGCSGLDGERLRPGGGPEELHDGQYNCVYEPRARTESPKPGVVGGASFVLSYRGPPIVIMRSGRE